MQDSIENIAVEKRLYSQLVAEGYLEDPAKCPEVRVCVTPHWNKPDGYFLRLFGEVMVLASTRSSPTLASGYLLAHMRMYRPETTLVLLEPDCRLEDFMVCGNPMVHTTGTDWWGKAVEFERTTVGAACGAAEAAIDRGEMGVPHAYGPSTGFRYPGKSRLSRWGAPSYKELEAASELVRQEIAAVGGLDLRWGEPVLDTRVKDRIAELARHD